MPNKMRLSTIIGVFSSPQPKKQPPTHPKTQPPRYLPNRIKSRITPPRHTQPLKLHRISRLKTLQAHLRLRVDATHRSCQTIAETVGSAEQQAE